MAKAGGGVRVVIQGDVELIKRLKALRTTEANKIIRKGLRAGAKEVHRETVHASPVVSGKMKKSYKVRAMKRKRGRIGVQIQSGEGFFQGETFYAGFVVLGHRVGPRRLGDARRKVDPNEFMKIAADKAAPGAIRVLNETVKAELEKPISSVKISGN